MVIGRFVSRLPQQQPTPDSDELRVRQAQQQSGGQVFPSAPQAAGAARQMGDTGWGGAPSRAAEGRGRERPRLVSTGPARERPQAQDG